MEWLFLEEKHQEENKELDEKALEAEQVWDITLEILFRKTLFEEVSLEWNPEWQ